MSLRLFLIAALGTCSIASWLRGAEPVEIWTATDLKGVSAKLASDKSAIGGVTLGKFAGQSCAVWHRTRSGEAELHKSKTDLLIIEEGNATLLFGGSIPAARVSAVDEVRGVSIHGGQSRKVSAGDIIRIPPNTPHQFLLSDAQTVTYFAVKIDAKRSATMQ